MSYDLEIPQKHIDAMAKVATRRKFFYGKKNIPNNCVFLFKEENHRNFMTKCLEEIQGKTRNTEKWNAGVIVMGNDRSYERSFYEVLADNGVFVLLLCRRFEGKNITNEWQVHIELRENYSVTMDHLLEPSNVIVQLPVNWVEDYKEIKVLRSCEFGGVTYLEVNSPKVYDFFNKPDRYEEWLKQNN